VIKSLKAENLTPVMEHFKKETLAHTVQLADVKAEDYDIVFYPGRLSPM